MKDKQNRLSILTRRLSVVAVVAGIWMVVAPIISLVQLRDARAVIAPLPTVEPSTCAKYINFSISSAYTFIVLGALTIGFAALVFKSLSQRNKKIVGEDPNN
jgi:hypothetical protein